MNNVVRHVPDVPIGIKSVIVILIAVITLITTWIRLHYGVDITDETYYIAEAYLITQGGIPIVNIWGQTPGAPFLYFPLVWLYNVCAGNMDGIVLFMRKMFFIYKILVLVLVYMLMRKYINPKLLILFLLPLIPFVPGSLFMFSYNTITILFFILGGMLLTAGFLENNKSLSVVYTGISGAVFAMAALANVSQIITVFIIWVIVSVADNRYSQNKKLSITFLAGGLGTALITTIILSILGGGIEKLFDGIRIILTEVNYFKIEHASYLLNWQSLKSMGNQLMIYSGVCAVIYIVLNYIFKQVINVFEQRRLILLSAKSTLLISLALGTLLFTIYVWKCFASENQIILILSAVLVWVPLVLYYLISDQETRKRASYLILFIWVPFFFYFITSSYTAWDGVAYRYYILFPGAILSVIFFYYAFREQVAVIQSKAVSCLASFSVYLLAIVLIGSVCINYYMFMYRDAEFWVLDYKIPKGIYQGLYTTKDRGEALIDLEIELKSIIDPDERVLFMDLVPMGYLMTEAIPCTPSAWDQIQYSYGFTNDDILQSYFRITGSIPDKIVYVFTGRDEVLSIDKNNYEFNAFVNKHYYLALDNLTTPLIN